MSYCLLTLSLLGALAATLCTTVEPWFQNWKGNRTASSSLVEVALGDGRKLFARHFVAKADAYFHNGYYATIFDTPTPNREQGVAAIGKDCPTHDSNILGQPKDWIDKFSRYFYPSRHTHLGDRAVGSCEYHQEGHQHGEHCKHGDDQVGLNRLEREILPWMRFAAYLDPHRVDTYVVASYWLRKKLGKIADAEQFLREGLRANPNDCEILFELGRLYYEDRKDPLRARNILELSLREFLEREAAKAEPDRFLYGQILNELALLEREQNNPARAITHYKALLGVTPNPVAVQAWIDWLTTNSVPSISTPN